MNCDKSKLMRLIVALFCILIAFQSCRALRWTHPLTQGAVKVTHTASRQEIFTGRVSSRSPDDSQNRPAEQETDTAAEDTAPVVHLNTATEAELETLPGIGPAKARAILEYRETHGKFTSYEALLEVDGIGPATLEALMPYLTLE